MMSRMIMMTKNNHQSGFWPFGLFCLVYIENNGWSLLIVMIDGGDEKLMANACRSPHETR